MSTIFIGAETQKYKKFNNITFEELRNSIDESFLNRLRTRVKSGKIKVKKIKSNIEAFLDYYDSFQVVNDSKTQIHILRNDNQEVGYIYHMADIHIDIKLDRVEEYKYVFTKLYESLRKEKKNGVIVIVGDILDKKLSLQPECIITTLDFFSELSSLFPVVCIAGNHDMIEHNQERVDSLTAILHHRALTNFFYLKKSGAYQFNNLVFGVSSLHDGEFIKASSIDTNLVKVGLWHGTVDTSTNLVGFELRGDRLLEDFNGYDICCLGDVHKFQYLDENKRVAYSSSLICQNYGEANDKHHGYLVWNISDFSSEYRIIENEYMHMSYTLDNNKIVFDKKYFDLESFEKHVSSLPSHGKYRVKYDQSTDLHLVDQFISIIKSKTTSPKIDKKPSLVKIKVDDTKHVQQHTLTYHLSEFCRQKQIDYESVVKEINNIDNTVLTKERKETIQWKLLTLKFDNMFGFGEGNTIDFSKFPLNEVIGIYAKNGWGKSSIIDIILFMLFSKISRTNPTQSSLTVPSFLIHIECESFQAELSFSVGSDIYLIQKQGKRSETKKIKITTKFYKNGEDLTDEDRKKTEKNISDLIGTYQDFISTSVSLQNYNDSFKDKSQTEKKEFLTRMLKLDTLSSIQKPVEKSIKEVDNRLILVEQLVSKVPNLNDLLQLEKDIEVLSNQKDSLTSVLEQKQNEIISLQSLLHNVSSVTAIESELRTQKQLLQTCMETLGVKEKEHTHYKNQISFFKLLDREQEITELHETLEKQKKDLYSKLHQVSYIPTLQSIEEAERKLEEINTELGDLSEEYEKINQNNLQIIELQKEITCNTFLDYVDPSDLIILEKELESLLDIDYEGYCRNLILVEELEKELSLCKSFADKLKSHKYNPNCEYCVNNPLVLELNSYIKKIPLIQKKLDATLIDHTVPAKKSKYDSITYKINQLKSSIAKKKIDSINEENQNLHKKCQKIKQMTRIKEQLEKEIKALDNKRLKEEIALLENRDNLYEKLRNEKNQSKKYHTEISELQNVIAKLNNKRDNYLTLISLSERNLLLSKENAVIYESIKLLQNEIIDVQQKINTLEIKKSWLDKEIKVFKENYDLYEKTLDEKQELTDKKKLYENLSMIISKNGLSLYMLEYYLPIITKTVNTIIEPYIRKTIDLSLNNKNESIDMNLYTEQKQPVNLFSGAESFITDLAFKITLGYYAVVSKSSVIFIDEAISCLDADKIKNIDTFLDFLKTHYDQSFLISHIQEMKEKTPYTIEIVRLGSKSKVTVF